MATYLFTIAFFNNKLINMCLKPNQKSQLYSVAAHTMRQTGRLSAAVSLAMLLSVSTGTASAAGSNQTASAITVVIQNKTISEVLETLKKSYGYVFYYSSETIDTSRRVSLNVKGQSIDNVMKQLLEGSDCTYSINGKKVYIQESKTKAVKQQTKKPSANQRKLTGSVTDATTGEPLVGVTIQVKGVPGKGAITDIDGNYSIDVNNKTELVFSYVGYKQQSLTVNDLGVMDVKLMSDNEVISEVVVVGAGTQKKISVTGSISTLKGSNLIAPSSSLTSNLTGKLAGVLTSTSSGEPGSPSDFYIRGISTFGGRTTPLILLDGVEITVNDLNNLPAESIENFSILKDASATAIYGARGANGVMLITTKSGQENTRANINIKFETSLQQPVNVVEFTDGATYMKTYNEAQLARNPNSSPRYTDKQIEYTESGLNPYVYPNVDWYDLIFQDYTVNQRANINVTGGGSRVTYYMGLQANHDTGILNVPQNYSIKNNYDRWMYTFQNNIGYKLTSSTKLDLRINAQIGNTTSPNKSFNDIFQSIYTNNPVTFPAYYPNEEGIKGIKFGSGYLDVGRYYTNPYAEMVNSFRKTESNKLNISLNIDQKLDFITEGLSVTGLINFNNFSEKYFTRSLTPYLYMVDPLSFNPEDPTYFQTQLLRTGTDYLSQSGVTRASNNTFYLDARINYARRFKKHNVTGMLMCMMREYSADALPNRNQGFSGRATYDYDNRYLIEFNFGYNGTERLKEKRFEFFPAVSLGWVVSGEKFWKPIEKYVDFFKIRASYGIVGSDETGTAAGAPHFLYLNSVNVTGGPGFYAGYLGNEYHRGGIINSYATANPCWERAKDFDLGVDIRLFNQVNITLDYYNNKRDRILMKRASFPNMLGYGNAIPWSNIGKATNSGLELSMNWSKQFSKDFNMDLRFNYTYSRNKYVYVDEPDYPYVWQTNTGKPIGHVTGYIAEGLFKDQADIDNHADQTLLGSTTIMPGDIKYRDINGDGLITQEDQVVLSNYGNLPRVQYGFGASFRYKNLDFSVFFNGSGKRTIMINNIYPFCANDTNDFNLMKWIADSHWTEGADNSNVEYPRLGVLTTQIANNMQPSSYWMRNGRYLKFKTLEVGYTFPICRVYFSGDNLAIWSPFKYWSPELSYNSYPLSRTFNLGVQFKL